MITVQSFDSRIRELKNRNLSDADFYDQLAIAMAQACRADEHWLLLVDDNGIEVLSESDDDLHRFHEVAAWDENFDDTLDWTLEGQQVRMLTLDGPQMGPQTLNTQANQTKGSRLPSDRFASVEDVGGDLFFVPVASPYNADIMICLLCHDLIADMGMLEQFMLQLTTLAALGELRVAAAISNSIQANAEQRLQEDRKKYNSLQEALELGTAVSISLEKEKSAFVLANELQSYLGVDRLTVIEQLGSKSKILAISGQVALNRRANVVRHAEHLAKVVLKSNEALWFGGDQETLARPVQKAVENYLSESLVQSFALIPIYHSTPPVYPSDEQSLIELVNPGRTEEKKIRGAILLESIQNPIERESVEQRWEQVQPLVSRQFSNSKTYSDLFLLPLMLMLSRFVALFRGHTKRTAWGLTLGASILIAAGFLIPADFKVRCEGYLQPKKMHHVFVRKDGVVTNVLVKEGQMVQRGDILVQLKNRELDFEMADLSGELKEKKQEHKHMIYRRLNYSGNESQSGNDISYNEMAEQTGIFEKQIVSLEKKLALKQRQMDDLAIRAPFSGQVMGWNVERKFLNRPLEQGTRMFSVAKVDENRILELKIPDRRSGYVQAAFQTSVQDEENLEVEFSIASFPDQRFAGEVTHVNPGLEQDTDLGYVLPIEANPISDLPENVRAGIPVAAKVICGRRSFIYCKTYEFVDWVNRTAFEYVY